MEIGSRRYNLMSKRRWRHLKWGFSLITVLLVLLPTTWSLAQEPNVEKTPVLNTIESLAPPDIQELFVNSSADVTTAPVRLDGRSLFLVAAPVVNPQSANRYPLSAQQRAREVERRLHDMIKAGLNPESLKVTQEFDQQSNQPIVQVNGQYLMTVTSLDAQLQGYSNASTRAREIVRSVEDALQAYYAQRRPAYLQRQSWIAVAIAASSFLVYWTMGWMRSWLRRRRNRISESLAQSEDIAAQENPEEPTTALRRRYRENAQRGIIDLERALLKVGQLACGVLGLYVILGLFPYTRWLQMLMLDLLKLPIKLGILALVTYWLLRLGTVWVDRLFIALQEGAALAPERSQRLGLRFSTFSHVVKGVLYFVTFLIALIVALGSLGVRLGPLLTGAGLVGLAFSLASQSLIQDFINGFLILLEDQYGVGDVIVVGDVWGFVENMNLRITQLRNEEGRLITIPNSKVAVVQNLSKEWSRVDLMIPVALTADLNAALMLVERVANDLRQDTIWGQLILEPPLLLGVDHLDHAGATIRLWIKTQPLKQWDVAREYRRRLKLAFEDAGIAIGVPQQVVHFSNSASGNGNGASPMLHIPVGTKD